MQNKELKNKLSQMFLKGLIAVLPVSITFYVLMWFISKIDSIGKILPQSFQFPGLGILLGLLVVLAVGFLLNNFLAGQAFLLLEEQLLRIPFVKTIYGPLKDLMGLFNKNSEKEVKKVVLVDLYEGRAQMLGLVTRDDFTDIAEAKIAPGKVAVYIPASYLIGGMTLIVPKSSVHEIDMPVDKAMKLAITGWIVKDHSKHPPTGLHHGQDF